MDVCQQWGVMASLVWSGARLVELEEMLRSGKTMEECSVHFGVSKTRISQVRKVRLKHLKREDIGKRVTLRKAEEIWRAACEKRFGRPTFRPSSDLEAAFSRAFIRKRQNVKATDWEFTVERSDIEWPIVCPVLGLELDWFSEKRSDASPSFDRIDAELGYIPGNVAIISWRANRIKNDGTAEEHRAIADWLDAV